MKKCDLKVCLSEQRELIENKVNRIDFYLIRQRGIRIRRDIFYVYENEILKISKDKMREWLDMGCLGKE